MNWVDFLLLGTLAAGGLVGMWIGLVRASFSVIGVLAGFMVVAQFRGDAATWLAGYLANDSLVTVLSYATVIFATAAVTLVASKIVRKLVYGMFMGWADRLGGMTAGLAVGAVLAAAVILGMAGFSYGTYSINEGVPETVWSLTPFEPSDVTGLETKLVESSVVSFVVSTVDIIPNQALELAPDSWRDTLADLESRLESLETAQR